MRTGRRSRRSGSRSHSVPCCRSTPRSSSYVHIRHRNQPDTDFIRKMSDDGTTVEKKRGRKPAAAVEESPKEAKKRGRQPVEKKEKSDGETPAKRGRGRPKGSVKKGGKVKAKPKAPSSTGRGRGRPKKDDKKADSAEDEEEEEDEGDDN